MRILVRRITFLSLEKDHMVFHAKFKPLLFDKFPRIKSVLSIPKLMEVYLTRSKANYHCMATAETSYWPPLTSVDLTFKQFRNNCFKIVYV